MEYRGNIARKTGNSSLLATEAVKTQRAKDIGENTGLFYVPRVLDFDAQNGVLNFERVCGLVTLLELSAKADARLFGLLEQAGEALAAIHKKLVLPNEMRHDLPPEWMDSADENVFIHGDFGFANLCFDPVSEQLVIVDWSTAPLMGKTATFGSRYFDIVWCASFAFRVTPNRRVLSWNAEGMADAFLRGYTKSCSEDTLKKLEDYRPHMLRLHCKHVLYHLSRQPLWRIIPYLLRQFFMGFRLWRYSGRFVLRRYFS